MLSKIRHLSSLSLLPALVFYRIINFSLIIHLNSSQRHEVGVRGTPGHQHHHCGRLQKDAESLLCPCAALLGPCLCEFTTLMITVYRVC
jgi:hypothetical protein